MKPISRVACGALLALVFYPSHAQEARIEEVQIYEDKKGVIYLNAAYHLNQEDSPVQITKVTVRHRPRKTAALASAYLEHPNLVFNRRERRRLRRLSTEDLTIFIDAEGREAVAVKFGIVVYGAFKEFLDSLTGVTVDPPTVGMNWTYRPFYLYEFEKHGVVGVYVRQARLKDGRIWSFDEDLVTSRFSESLGEVTREQIVASDTNQRRMFLACYLQTEEPWCHQYEGMLER